MKISAAKAIFLSILFSGVTFAVAPLTAQDQVIYRAGSYEPLAGLEAHFTGDVTVTPLFPANDHLKYSGAVVTFTPCARTDWHTHPAGQLMMVTEGEGFTQTWGGPLTAIHAGDIIWCPPDVKHWHGAAPDQSMTHTVLSGYKDGSNVNWLEKVTDEQYRGK